MSADSFSKKEILAVLKTLLDRGEEKIPDAVVREALAPYRSAILQGVESTLPNMDRLDQILKQLKAPALPPPAENIPESLP